MNLMWWGPYQREKAAKAKLQQIVDQTRASLEVAEYRKHRTAAKDGWAKRRGMA